MKTLIAIDPGYGKCGLILADIENHTVLYAINAGKKNVIFILNKWLKEEDVKAIIMGNGTSSKYWSEALNIKIPIYFIDEGGSTLQARRRYFEIFPPNLFYRLLPSGIIPFPKNLDLFAALVLMEKYLGRKLTLLIKPDFKTWL
tara:strand:- start:6560 stop:6991 length:432 start_codon:yes stop_codon:yes gene_type:complete